MLHTLRTWLNDDALWRNILRGLQKEFYHQTVTTEQIENYISKASGKNLDPFFDQYLRDIRVPTFEFSKKKKTLRYRYANIVPGFNMPLDVTIDKDEKTRIYPTSEWQTIKQNSTVNSLQVDPNFYILIKEIGKG